MPGAKRWMRTAVTSSNVRAIVAIVVAVIVANGAFTLLGYDANPIWWTAGVSTHHCDWYCGLPTIDPNVGFITQPFGHLAALDLLHGHLPWWNYFEGLGQPLAGEMQSAALLPLVLLFVFPVGLVLFHLSFQIIAGVTTYFLLRRLGTGAVLAALGGALFAMNGTFAWIANAVVNPIAFMPMMLLGIENVIDATARRRRAGWVILALGIALSIYAGFPEMAYLDGLFCAGWAVTRLFSLDSARRRAGLARLAAGGVVGLALSAPIVVAFFDYMKTANVGAHAAKGLAMATTAPHTLAMLVDPYLGGALFGGSPSTPGNLLGYATASVAVFALVGATGRRLRALRLFLAGWVVAVLAGVLNLLFVRRLWNALPTMREIAFARYIWPTVEIAVIVLAILGLGDLLEGAVRRRRAVLSCVLVGAIALAGVFANVPLGGLVGGSVKGVVGTLIVLPFIAVAVLAFALLFLDARWLSRVAVAVLVLESLAYFAAPTLRNPASVTVDSGTISYLQQHQGMGRFFALGVLNPNWGSQYAINEFDAIDLPDPVNFTDFVKADVDPKIKNPRIFTLPFTPDNENDIASHITALESVGVAYLLTPMVRPTDALAATGITLVAQDSNSKLYLLPHPSAFYSTSLASCTLSAASVDHVTVTCPAATTLTRRELYMAGWRARVNGHATAITTSDTVTESIALPAGTSQVSFDFLPPHEEMAGLIALAGLAAIAATWLPWRPSRRGRPRAGSASDDASAAGPDPVT